MKLLVTIGYVWPEPKSSAAGSHMLSILKLFKAQGWRVIFATPAQKTEFSTDLESLGIECASIQVNNSDFDSWIKSLSPDVVLFDRFLMEEQFGWRVAEQCPNALRLLDTEDLQCLRGAREKAAMQHRPFVKSDLNSELAKREIASIYRCDLSLIISSFEYQLLTDHFNISPTLIHLLPFMVDVNSLPTNTPAFAQREHFITIGNLRHAPNWDSVLFLQSIWPKIRKQLPSAELHIYGAYTPPKATALNNKKNGFIIKDRAVDVIDVLQHARVCLSPLRFGAGIKGKFIDAMQAKTPIVTTQLGTEGMHDEQPWPGLIGENENEIVEASVRLYSDEREWKLASDAAYPLLKSKYDKDRLEIELINRIQQQIMNLVNIRQTNFIGGMLNYHGNRSTEFFSRWIEEKNRVLKS